MAVSTRSTIEVPMRMQLRSNGLIAVVLLVVVCLGGCGTWTVGRSSGSAGVGPREVKFSLDGPSGIVAQPDSATITFTGGKVVVEKARVLLNDKEVAKVPEGAKVVAVDYTTGTLTITADGTKVHEAQLSK
jgi:hypothetical protein